MGSQKEFLLEFVRYSSAKKLVVSFLRNDHPDVPAEKLLLKETSFVRFLGVEYDRPVLAKEILKRVRSHGLWGYCRHRSKKHAEIHYWIGKREKIPAISIIELLSHEIAHAFGYSGENRACKISAIAGLAFQEFVGDLAGIRKGKTR